MAKSNVSVNPIIASVDSSLPEKLDPSIVGVKSGRVAAPNIHIESPHGDERFAQTAELDERNPEWTHVYQSADIDARTLRAKNMEVVAGENGEPLRHRGDVVCRIKRELFEKPLKRDGLLSRKQIKEVNGGKDLTKFAAAKSPIDFGSDDLDKELNELNN
jgi:hypothetical protein